MRIAARDINESDTILEFNTPADRFPTLREMVRRNECEFESALHTRLRVIRIGDLIEVEGETAAMIRFTCGRCLADFVVPLSVSLALTYAERSVGPH
jgi:hypothetical protein